MTCSDFIEAGDSLTYVAGNALLYGFVFCVSIPFVAALVVAEIWFIP